VASFVSKMKSTAKRFAPAPLRRLVGEYLAQRWNAKHANSSVEEIFSAIYKERRWEANSSDDFSSGTGSRTESVVSPYVDAVRTFLRSLPCPPSAVDLGCGDFKVGAQLRPYCARYVACDVVPALIERNKEKFAAANVDFRCLDIIEGDLPDGEIAFLRQVLQHLSNDQILKVAQKLNRYKFLILTEHLPANPNFVTNRDKSTGGGIRLSQNSGVVLTAPPFQLKVKSETVLCTTNESIGQHQGIIKTTLYEMHAD
jgi:Methyltransferase domain